MRGSYLRREFLYCFNNLKAAKAVQDQLAGELYGNDSKSGDFDIDDFKNLYDRYVDACHAYQDARKVLTDFLLENEDFISFSFDY